MSTMIESSQTSSLSTQTSKKRKIESDTPIKSKKKRKQAEQSDEIAIPSSAPSANGKEKKQKKKVKNEVEESTVIPETQTQELEDVELPDADAPAIPTTEIESTPDVDQILPTLVQEVDDTILKSKEPSCFYSKRISLYVPIPAMSQSSSKSSLLSLHLAPLLLTYFPPAEGIVLSFSDPMLSAEADNGVNLPLIAPRTGEIPRNPPNETFARCADGFGVCWVWLTATFLVFQPQIGDRLKGWTNVQSEGFVGLVSYNYFQTAVGKERIPKGWVWDGPTRETARKRRIPKKSRLRDEDGDTAIQDGFESSQVASPQEDAIDGGSGSFIDANGNKIEDGQTFKVIDIEMVPGHEKDRWTLQVDGSLLSDDQEAVAVAEDKRRFEAQNRSRSRSKTPGFEDGELPLMSGGLGLI